jgi:Ser/Thr protein kinase RdoA (MazF antagonist)
LYTANKHNLVIVRQRERLARAVATVLPAYGLAPQATFELICISENATYRIVDPDQGPFILRLHRSGYLRRQEIRSELAWLDALRDAGLRTPRVVPTTSGDPIASIYETPLADERHCVMFELVPGAEVGRTGWRSWAERVGTLAARMHEISRAWSPPSWFCRPSWDADTLVGEVARWGTWRNGPARDARQEALLLRAQQSVQARMCGFDPAADGLGRVLVHADLRLTNLMVNEDDITVIDFDDTSWSWPVWDLIGYVRNMEGDEHLDDVIAAWLRGYRSVTPISEAAEAAVPTLMLAARLQVLGWLGTHPYTRLASGRDAAYLAKTCELADAYLAEADR